jgi:putative endonuclease
MRQFYVYILSNKSRVLYTGVTNDLHRRMHQHRNEQVPGFTKRYRIKQLVFYQRFAGIRDAIARERQVKGWTRAKKIALIESMNPHWADLGETLAADETDAR